MKILMLVIYLMVIAWFGSGCGDITNVQSVDSSSGSGGHISLEHGTGGHLDSGSPERAEETGSGGQGGGNLVGAYCSSNQECATNYCHMSDAVNGICAIPPSPNNQPCQKDSDCISNYCHPDLGICLTVPVKKPAGETCNFDMDCIEWCNTDYLLCAARRLANGACTRDVQCVSTICDMQRKVCL